LPAERKVNITLEQTWRPWGECRFFYVIYSVLYDAGVTL